MVQKLLKALQNPQAQIPYTHRIFNNVNKTNNKVGKYNKSNFRMCKNSKNTNNSLVCLFHHPIKLLYASIV